MIFISSKTFDQIVAGAHNIKDDSEDWQVKNVEKFVYHEVKKFTLKFCNSENIHSNENFLEL
jgi:hypothetical protein